MRGTDPEPNSGPAPGPREGEDPEAEGTGLPGLRSWRAVYALVLASFVVWMALLFILGQVFR